MSKNKLSNMDPEAFLLEVQKKIFSRIASEGLAYAKSKAPDSIRDTLQATVQPTHISIRTDHPGAIYMEVGAKPHVIVPNKAKYLRFVSSSGDLVYTKLVNHPGVRKQPFLKPAANFLKKRVVGIAKEVVKEMLSRL